MWVEGGGVPGRRRRFWVGREVERLLGGDLWCGRGEGERRGVEAEVGRMAAAGGRFCGCGWFEGLLFWVVVGVKVVGGMGGEGEERGGEEGEGEGCCGKRGRRGVLLRGPFSGL